MSVVLYANGALWSDTRAYFPRMPSPGRKKKLYAMADGTVVGIVSSVLGHPERFVVCLNDPALDREWQPDLTAVRVIGRGQIEIYNSSFFPAGPIRTQRYAVGSGAEFALGALAVGASPRAAIEAACKLDTNCGGPVDVLWP